MGKFDCEICGDGPSKGPVYRQNEPGEMPAIWRCKKHHTRKPPIDPVVLDITQIIEDDNRKKP